MRIGLDVDGILYEWERTARYMLREVLPDSPYTKDGPLGVPSTRWNYIKDNVSREHNKWLWDEGVKLGMFRHGHLYPGTIEAVKRLARRGQIVIITHRPERAVPDTLAWLAYHQLPLSEIHILSNQEPKSQISNLDVFLDDKPENCTDMLKTGAEVCIWDRPWNQQAVDGVIRLSSWATFERVVEHRRHTRKLIGLAA